MFDDDARTLGLAFASHLGGRGKTVAVGWDVRKSSVRLANALMEGITLTGADVLSLGLMPTPMIYFAIVHRNLDGGVVVTASHNPPEWNGFKLCRERAKLCGLGTGLEEVKRIVKERSFKYSDFKGVVKEERKKVFTEYEDFLMNMFKDRISRLKVLLDPGNGACSLVGSRILQKLGLKADSINDYPNGDFPSRSPEPTAESLSVLRRMVKEGNYDFGVGYDGDGDRALFVDNEGNVLRGDTVLVLLIKHFLKNKPGEKIVYDVSCSKLVEEVSREKGIIPVMSRVGHTFILEKMISENAFLEVKYRATCTSEKSTGWMMLFSQHLK